MAADTADFADDESPPGWTVLDYGELDSESEDEWTVLHHAKAGAVSDNFRSRTVAVEKAKQVVAGGATSARGSTPIFVDSASEEEEPEKIVPMGSKIVPDTAARASTPPIYVHSDDEPVDRAHTPISVSDDDEKGALPPRAVVLGRRRAPAKAVTLDERKKKTKRQRDAMAVTNTRSIFSFMVAPSASSSRVSLDRRRRSTARSVPLAGGGRRPSSAYSARLNRAAVMPFAPPLLPTPPVNFVYTAGSRQSRRRALEPEDLYVVSGDGSPPPIAQHPDHECCICRQLKSHPMSYTCGHGFCYVCIRMALETRFECPVCRHIICQEPFRVFAEDSFLLAMYGEWDKSEVDYSFEGLSFPKRL
ncbi:hypothetical protein C8R43DRAFT_1139628 [Mycena crocata]|nr:hypothetical protein C8R43DRAFT_1139628 [Mycena crocata]